MNNLELALSLAARSWSIFPCHEAPQEWQGRILPKKSPYIKDWPNRSTWNEDKIKSWWAWQPGALVGVNCQASGIFCLDVDAKGEIDGYKTFGELAAASGANLQIVCGPIQRTPSGGLHMIFRAPMTFTIPTNTGVLGPGLDLRGIGGYFCTGPEYSSDPGHSLPGAMLTDAPNWLLDVIRKKEQEQKPIPTPHYTGPAQDAGEFWLFRAIDQARPGRRNSTGFWLACELRDAGLTMGQAEIYMCQYADAVGNGDYSKFEALESLKSAYKRAPRETARSERRNHDNGRT